MCSTSLLVVHTALFRHVVYNVVNNSMRRMKRHHNITARVAEPLDAMRGRTALHANTKQTHGGTFICCSNLFGAQEAMNPTTHSLLKDTCCGVCLSLLLRVCYVG
jgi:hypothetical protein